ncbi:hypothetical protein BGZ54_007637, partial [Gamsiella multidivaricata]
VKTRIQIETSELEHEIRQLEKTIIEQERKLAAKRTYEESIRESEQRSEAAKAIYKNLTSPVATTSAPKQISGNPNAHSFLPETFLQDLKLTFLDTRGAKDDAIRQLQSGLSSTKELLAATSGAKDGQESEKEAKEDSSGTIATADKDANALALERVGKVGIDKWNQLIYVNALERNSNNAEQVMQMMEDVGVQPNMESFSYLMEAYANSGELKKAQDTIELILKSGLVPAIPAYNSLMKIHVRRRDITGAFKVFEALKKHHSPDVDVFTNLVKGCLRAGEYDLGWKVFDQMQRSGATPVESTYSLMIHACAKTDQVERALDIFRTYPSRHLQPTDATFNSLIHACAMRPEYFATAFALLKEMQDVYGFEPDILTYNTLLFACSKRQDLLTARRVFQKVVQLDSEGVLALDGITVTNFLWCITEWKDTEVHLRNRKYRLRNLEHGQIQLGTTTSSVIQTAPAEISIRPLYFLLPERPPKDEREALAEGESVFSWFVSRSAERFPFLETEAKPLMQGFEQGEDYSSSDVATTNDSATDLSLPRLSFQSPIRTRLLNAYLAMHVRHQDIDKSIVIYRKYFGHFMRKRDSWTYATMLEGCYYWKNVDLGAEVFKDWRDWRKSTGKLTEKKTRQADYQCYRRMVNLLARTNHLDESIALLEELSIAATPTNTRLRSEIAAAAAAAATSKSSEGLIALSSASTISPTTTSNDESELTSSLSFLDPIQDEAILPIYPKLKDFPVVYTKTWELEDEAARKILLRLCHGKPDSVSSSSSRSSAEGKPLQGESETEDSILPDYQDKRQARYQKSIRNTAIKWKGEHPQEKGFYVGNRRFRELDQDLSKRSQDQRRR